MTHIMKVYVPLGWVCPKCETHAHRTSYVGHNDTLTVTCGHCGYWESMLPRDRDE